MPSKGNPAPFRWTLEDRPIPIAVTGSAVLEILHAPVVQYAKERYSGGASYPMPVPIVPGANAVARIHAVGNDATVLRVGDLVLLDCTIRARDSSANILLGFMAGSHLSANVLWDDAWRDGVWARYARVPLENVHKLDEKRLVGELGYEIADCTLIQTCAIAYGGLDDAGVRAGDTVIVAPATGRFSGATVLTALAMGANVVAAGRRQAALDELVKGLNNNPAVKTVLLAGDVERDFESFRNAVGPNGADVYVDWSPGAVTETPAYMTAAFGVLRRGGTVMVMGGIGGTVNMPYKQIMLANLVVRGRFMYERQQLEQVIKLAEYGRLPLGKHCGLKTVASFGLEQFEEALDEAKRYPGWAGIVNIVPSL
ncbi:isopropanol dehydrogenase [Microthyrium microscopicum]|uniref:Isopropanol dehydrogenase n=1 Tax=Microthyrium microscopicum TaxID=703497 RepID=A0A6A6UH65_9PEZI|nr:isopropanol dehydrogenase [Microthyrium microscopicum]